MVRILQLPHQTDIHINHLNRSYKSSFLSDLSRRGEEKSAYQCDFSHYLLKINLSVSTITVFSFLTLLTLLSSSSLYQIKLIVSIVLCKHIHFRIINTLCYFQNSLTNHRPHHLQTLLPVMPLWKYLLFQSPH